MDWDSDPELIAIKHDYIKSLAERRVGLQKLIDFFNHSPPTALELLDERKKEFQFIAHKIAGTAESYGFPTLTYICSLIDDALDGPAKLSLGTLSDWSQLLDTALEASGRGKDPQNIKEDKRITTLKEAAALA